MQKRGQIWETLFPWIIGLIVMGLMFVLYMTLYGKGAGLIDYLKSLFRLG